MSQVRHSTIIPEAFSLVDQVDLVRLRANKHINQQQRVALGQFMTPAAIARLMASMLICDTEHVSLLDAGAGVGSLLSAAVEQLSTRPRFPDSLHITAYEIDAQLIPYLGETLQWCVHVCRTIEVSCRYELIQADFIEDTVEQLTNPLFFASPRSYTCAILNPPYQKIQIKRFSSKEEQCRVVAVVHQPEDFPYTSIGFENHLNYFHATNHSLDAMFAYGLVAYLNSTIFELPLWGEHYVNY